MNELPQMKMSSLLTLCVEISCIESSSNLMVVLFWIDNETDVKNQEMHVSKIKVALRYQCIITSQLNLQFHTHQESNENIFYLAIPSSYIDLARENCCCCSQYLPQCSQKSAWFWPILLSSKNEYISLGFVHLSA